jgi:hypothetical protein
MVDLGGSLKTLRKETELVMELEMIRLPEGLQVHRYVPLLKRMQLSLRRGKRRTCVGVAISAMTIRFNGRSRLARFLRGCGAAGGYDRSTTQHSLGKNVHQT